MPEACSNSQTLELVAWLAEEWLLLGHLAGLASEFAGVLGHTANFACDKNEKRAYNKPLVEVGAIDIWKDQMREIASWVLQSSAQGMAGPVAVRLGGRPLRPPFRLPVPLWH